MTEKWRSRARILLYHASISVIVWAVLVLAFKYWIEHDVREEFRTGIRTDTGGDNTMIPIMGFAELLAKLLIAANLLIFLGYAVAAALRRPGRAA